MTCAHARNYWQFANGSIGPITLDVLMRIALTVGGKKIDSAWDRRLGAEVWYDA